MKQTATNQFNDGLNYDLHPMVTPNSVLTDNLNGTFITYNGNEFCLQNDRGNTIKTTLSKGYIPIGIKEHNGILYIVSYNPKKNMSEIGTYPSPNYETGTGAFVYDYKPLHNYYRKGSTEKSDLRTDLFNFDTTHPISIEIQDSYDGSINLILNDGKNQPIIINTAFSVDGEKYKLIERQGTEPTNTYHEETFEDEISMILSTASITNFDLKNVTTGGQLKGGNYTFYLKFGDNDYNKTDVVAESGIISIFNGTDGKPSTITGTLADERTDKMICLEISGINPAYSKLYIYYTREYSDTNGYRMSEAVELAEPIDIESENIQEVWITGFEQINNISVEDLNIDYHTIDYAKASAQQQDMLFLGNLGQQTSNELYVELRNITKNFRTSVSQSDSLNKVSTDYNSGDEYYSTQNIYNKLGYWPDEIYRFGVVYILKDGSTTPAFNMCGGSFTGLDSVITKNSHVENYNEDGVFLTPKVAIIGEESIKPLHFNFTVPDEFPDKVLGYFIVRQKRVPRTICQGYSIGVDKTSHLPLVWNGKEWMIESFLSLDRSEYTNAALYQRITELEKLKSRWWWGLAGWFALSLVGVILSPVAMEQMNAFFIGRSLIAGAELSKIGRTEEYLKNSKRPLLTYIADKKPTKRDTRYVGYIANIHGRTGFEWYHSGENKIKVDAVQEWYDGTTEFGAKTYTVTVEDSSKTYTGYPAYEEWKRNWTDEEAAQCVGIIDNVKDIGSNKAWSLTFDIYDISNPNNKINTGKKFIYVTTENVYQKDLLNNWRYENGPSEGIIDYDGERRKIVLLTNEDDTEWNNPEKVQDLINNVAEENALIDAEMVRDLRYISSNGNVINGYGLISLDPCVNNSVGGMLDGSEFDVVKEYDINTGYGSSKSSIEYEHPNETYTRIDAIDYQYVGNESESKQAKCAFVRPSTSYKAIDDYTFSNMAGSAYSIQQTVEAIEPYYVTYKGTSKDKTTVPDIWFRTGDYITPHQNVNLVRGEFCPYVGIASNDAVAKEGIYSIRHKESGDLENMFFVREQDNSPYYTISKRYDIEDKSTKKIYGGDCFTSTVSTRIIRNFIDPEVPYTDTIIDDDGWADMIVWKIKEMGESDTGSLSEDEQGIDPWSLINSADVNSVDLGYWVTYKCLSNYNLGLRSENTQNVQEMSLLGSARSFYPANGMSTATGNKVEESFLLNDGLSATVGQKRYTVLNDAPYYKNQFITRIAFSNKNVTDSFTNGYRVFQGLSYQDYDKQYGEIVKLVPWGPNLFCVFEHGLAILPVNEKALMQTTTEQSIHIYGHGVLPEQMSIVSQDYGTKYADSVIRTPIGIYGVDVDAKKIWRFSDKQGFETLSDMKIETFLNNNLDVTYDINVGKCDVRTHYNSFKGDVIFTWYKNGKENSICFNERQSLWITRYDWLPMISENINGEFYSLQVGEDSDPFVGIYSHEIESAKPTKWYGKQHPFEIEFVVSDPIGVHKIYENLQIISNNVQPEELQFEFIGDSYMFNKERLYHTTTVGDYWDKRVYKAEYYNGSSIKNPNVTDEISDEFRLTSKTGLVRNQNESDYKPFRNASKLNDRGFAIYGAIKKTENATEQYHLVIPQECRNLETWGRRMGNIHYKFDSWYTNIEPILYDARLNDPQITRFDTPVTKWNSARIRDKWCKIRVRYSGEDLAVITAIKTMLNI